jgi:hypothetical protein
MLAVPDRCEHRLGLFDEQGDRVVAPGSTGRRLLAEDDHGASGGTPISSSPIAWRRASAARRPLTGRACPDGRPGGGGVRWATPRTIKRRLTAAAGLRSLSPAVAVVGTRPDGALACRPGAGVRLVVEETLAWRAKRWSGAVPRRRAGRYSNSSDAAASGPTRRGAAAAPSEGAVELVHAIHAGPSALVEGRARAGDERARRPVLTWRGD